MGSTQSCFKQQNLNQNEFQIPVIAKSNFIQIHPTRQNYLIEPIHNLGEKQESLEELELILQQSNPCISFNYTATFHSNSNKKGSSQERQNISQILQPNHQEQQQNYKVNNKDNQNQNPQQILKQLEQKQEAKTNNQSQKRKSLSRSLSNFKQQKCDWKDDQQNKYKDSDCNTIKSILKKKQTTQNKKQLYKRGQSLKQKSTFVDLDDNQSQKTSKSQKKKVQFDPKIFRQKNVNFFQ